MSQYHYGFLLSELVLRDFRIRYRNMSLGVFWSLLNPLVMMGVLTFVFTRVFPVGIKDFHLNALTGLVVFNFFSLSWSSGTVSLLQNTGLIKRVPMPREIIPISTVLANGMHFVIQILMLCALVLASGYPLNLCWFWLPLLFLLEVFFVCGLCLLSAALDVYFRDVRYIVESMSTVLFWLVPIFYRHEMIPEQYHWVYWYNPVAAVVLCCRNVLLEGRIIPRTVVILAAVSMAFLVAGFAFFHRAKRRFADYM